MNNFAYFIMSYGKPFKTTTQLLLEKYNVKEKIFIVVGEDDPKYNEYLKNKDLNVITFNKDDYLEKVDSLGTYYFTHKVCTYARQFIDEYARDHKIQYCCILFDDILDFRLRYFVGNKIKATKDFNFNNIMYAYIKLLNCSPNCYLVGPPSSSYYIGICKEKAQTPATHYGNMFIYDTNKPLVKFTASVLEDMDIVLNNSKIGHFGLFPFGLQAICREPMKTGDCYQGINRSEYVQQHKIICQDLSIDNEHMSIPYRKFIPKIINERYKKK